MLGHPYESCFARSEPAAETAASRYPSPAALRRLLVRAFGMRAAQSMAVSNDSTSIRKEPVRNASAFTAGPPDTLHDAVATRATEETRQGQSRLRRPRTFAQVGALGCRPTGQLTGTDDFRAAVASGALATGHRRRGQASARPGTGAFPYRARSPDDPRQGGLMTRPTASTWSPAPPPEAGSSSCGAGGTAEPSFPVRRRL